MRTHGVRPSEKTTSAASRAFPRKAIRSGLTPRGGAGSARPDRRLGLDPGHVPIRPPGVPLPPMIMLCLGSLAASECGRTVCVPPRKPPSGASRGFPRKAIRSGLTPRGGAGSARPQRAIFLRRDLSALGQGTAVQSLRFVAKPIALLGGPRERVPPAKTSSSRPPLDLPTEAQNTTLVPFTWWQKTWHLVSLPFLRSLRPTEHSSGKKIASIGFPEGWPMVVQEASSSEVPS